ncbi:histone H2A-beta, sperm-like [Bradysia coprophila]|uniref:histone H2A-beta, sperm-like n=1 Tax=Bradysia coprophila TaxID=38358 RepID=UPI00187DC5B4|nr:histone H2A-beta, sperm-like [Bradysia coprophila]
MADRTRAEVINVMKPKEKRVTQSERAVLAFPVGRINRKLSDGNFAKRIGKGSAVYLTAVCEYLVAELLDVAIDEARKKKRMRINPRHITLGVRNDAELSQLLKYVTFSEGGVQPFVHEDLKHRISPLRLSKKSLKKSSEKSSRQS